MMIFHVNVIQQNIAEIANRDPTNVDTNIAILLKRGGKFSCYRSLNSRNGKHDQ